MKLVDIVNQFQIVLPQYTDLFSDLLDVVSIVSSGGVATVTTQTAHDLSFDRPQAITLAGVEIKTEIISVTQDGLVFTFGTNSDHDLTEGWPEHENVSLEGFTDSLWNNSFKLVGVPNRKTLKVQSTNSIPILSGSERLLEDRNDGVNGRYEPVVVDSTKFTIAGDFVDGTYTGGKVGKDIRIAGIMLPEDIEEYYTEQGLQGYYLFVSMPNAVVSKDRNAMSDATGTMATGQDIRMRILDGFNATIVRNTSDDLAGIETVDVCRHDLLSPIMKSVFGAKFDTGLSGGPDFKAILTGHGLSLYNRAVIEYTYSFEVAMDLTNEDTVEPGNTRAFRDVDSVQIVGGPDAPEMTAETDLDDEPL